MNAPVSIRELSKALLPLDHPNGWLAMLRAYFDDSGTHDASKIAVVAGLFGTEGRMDGLDRNWKKHLERPLDGMKAPPPVPARVEPPMPPVALPTPILVPFVPAPTWPVPTISGTCFPVTPAPKPMPVPATPPCLVTTGAEAATGGAWA